MNTDKIAMNWQQLTSSAVVIDTNSNFLGEIVQETFALTRRLFIQLQRRPSSLVAGIIQPVMWLVLLALYSKMLLKVCLVVRQITDNF